MVEDPPGDSTDAPDGDDLHLEPVSVEGVGTVLVLGVRGRLAEVAEPAYLSVLLGLAEEPAAVVCDVSGVTGPIDDESVALLASLGAEVEQWPGVPIAVVCPDPQLHEALAAHPDSMHLVVEPERGAGAGPAPGPPAHLDGADVTRARPALGRCCAGGGGPGLRPVGHVRRQRVRHPGGE